jgi:hypothetical protein
MGTEGASLALRVPSVVVPSEFNFLLNPAHDAFGTVVISAIAPLAFDARPHGGHCRGS